jgi:hypothetical protein
MNLADMEILEAVRKTVAGVAGVRLARLVGPGEAVEIPLSRMVAVLVEPSGVQTPAWPGVSAGRYRLLLWRLRVLDRAAPGTRAFEALVAIAGSCRAALAAAPTLGGLAEDGPPSLDGEDLFPAVGATRLGPAQLAEAAAGRPTALVLAGATGRWTETMSGVATIDGESLFASGPHGIVAGSPARRVKDQAFNGLGGGVTLDLGDGGRELVQTGVLSGATAQALAILEAAVESFIDGRAYTLVGPDGEDYPHCRLERFERLGPPLAGARWHQLYRITYRQLLR